MRKMIVLAVILVLALFAGCTSKSPASGTQLEGNVQSEGAADSQPAASTATSVNAANAQAFSQDILNCVKGSPWTYQGTTATGNYKVVYTVEGMADYNGKQYCKVTGQVQGIALPAGYSWEYYFRLNPEKTMYSEVCYKISFPGMAPQEGCSTPPATK